MKSTKHGIGYYTLTGYIGDNLAQYSIMKIGGFWAINKTYGNGPDFNMAYKTKSEAFNAIKTYGDK